jgi:glutathione synthase/RimK-type ligase-like ATP-grasp enzyme
MEIEAADADVLRPIGIARLSKLAFDGNDLKPLWRELVDRYVAGEGDAATLMDMATLQQLFGNVADGVACQKQALDRHRLYRSPCAAATPALRLLALAAPGDIGANTPLEFLLEGSDMALDTLYVVPGSAAPPALPHHDLAIVTVGESDANMPVLEEISRLTAGWSIPVLNDPRRIAGLSRQRLPALLKGAPGVVAPPTVRVARARLQHLADGHASVAELLGGGDFPLIVRPVDSHAGRGLQRITERAALVPYLAARDEARFFLAPFVDYSGADGLFRKYRIAFIGQRPFACHMAIADQWMIYYLNAGMRESAAKRAEEARFMHGFDGDFARRHADALSATAERIGLDYFAIDCAETRDGGLLMFEADIAMIVHAMDPADIFPYKGPQMRKLFDAFAALLRRRAKAA